MKIAETFMSSDYRDFYDKLKRFKTLETISRQPLTNSVPSDMS